MTGRDVKRVATRDGLNWGPLGGRTIFNFEPGTFEFRALGGDLQTFEPLNLHSAEEPLCH